MGKTFITGDRQGGHPVHLGLVAIELLRAVAQGDKIVTGENDGVEAMVRDLGERAGVEVSVVPNEGPLDNGKPDWDMRHRAQLANDPETRFVAVHTDPHTSSIIRSLSEIVGDDALRLVTHADLLV